MEHESKSGTSSPPAAAAATAAEAELTDHEYDGIQEYDNPMPRWWVLIFWGSFYFATAYFLWFHVYDKGSVSESYAADMRTFREEIAAREMGSGATEESLAKLSENSAVMADAASVFTTRCIQCHGPKGEGLIGPNLTDDHWIHGQGKLMDIHGVVKDGVLTKGMPAWGRQLQPMEVAKVVAYVGTLRGKNLPGKPPEGQKVVAAAPPSPGG